MKKQTASRDLLVRKQRELLVNPLLGSFSLSSASTFISSGLWSLVHNWSRINKILPLLCSISSAHDPAVTVVRHQDNGVPFERHYIGSDGLLRSFPWKFTYTGGRGCEVSAILSPEKAHNVTDNGNSGTKRVVTNEVIPLKSGHGPSKGFRRFTRKMNLRVSLLIWMIVGFIGLSLTAESSLADGKSNYLHICYQHCQQIIIPETLKVYSNQISRRYLHPYLPSIFHTSRIIYSALSVRAKVYTQCDSSRDFLLRLIPMKIIFAC
ncbi:hypothetical protein KQX54_002882 [Cotesia glomerata]|uniref:Uncharacterized protein n=1 Tax=Cotesia glomerata TaxID=32391 RepID=A0AAV7J6S4_COTGL|nr:hypothetical protein KQX54_002882 [Cotesia glomerata]